MNVCLSALNLRVHLRMDLLIRHGGFGPLPSSGLSFVSLALKGKMPEPIEDVANPISSVLVLLLSIRLLILRINANSCSPTILKTAPLSEKLVY